MSRNLIGLVILFSIVNGIYIRAQNLLTDGNMESMGGWDTVNVIKNTHGLDLSFNYTESTPSAGDGGCLHISSFASASEELFNIDVMIFHPVTLTPGKTYYISGAYKDLTESGMANFWSEVAMSRYNPKDSVKSGATFFMAFNTWKGCGSNYNGTYQDGSCRYNVPDSIDENKTIPNPFFRVPDTLTGEQTYYLIFETGTWDDSNQDRFIDYVIDEIRVEDSATAIIEPFVLPEEPSAISLAHQNDIEAELYNYPNPFDNSTTISFSLPENTKVTLCIRNSLGEKIETLIHEYKTAGRYQALFNSQNIPEGLYYYTLEYNNKIFTNKMIVIK